MESIRFVSQRGMYGGGEAVPFACNIYLVLHGSVTFVSTPYAKELAAVSTEVLKDGQSRFDQIVAKFMDVNTFKGWLPEETVAQDSKTNWRSIIEAQEGDLVVLPGLLLTATSCLETSVFFRLSFFPLPFEGPVVATYYKWLAEVFPMIGMRPDTPLVRYVTNMVSGPISGCS